MFFQLLCKAGNKLRREPGLEECDATKAAFRISAGYKNIAINFTVHKKQWTAMYLLILFFSVGCSSSQKTGKVFYEQQPGRNQAKKNIESRRDP